MADEWNAALADEATLKKDRKERKKLDPDAESQISYSKFLNLIF